MKPVSLESASQGIPIGCIVRDLVPDAAECLLKNKMSLILSSSLSSGEMEFNSLNFETNNASAKSSFKRGEFCSQR